MIQRADGSRLLFKTPQPVRISDEGARQHLDSDVAAKARVARLIDLAHPARADKGDNFVGTQQGARGKSRRDLCTARARVEFGGDRRLFQEACCLVVRRQQPLDLGAQIEVRAAGFVEKRASLVRRLRERSMKERLYLQPAFSLWEKGLTTSRMVMSRSADGSSALAAGFYSRCVPAERAASRELEGGQPQVFGGLLGLRRSLAAAIAWRRVRICLTQRGWRGGPCKCLRSLRTLSRSNHRQTVVGAGAPSRPAPRRWCRSPFPLVPKLNTAVPSFARFEALRDVPCREPIGSHGSRAAARPDRQ